MVDVYIKPEAKSVNINWNGWDWAFDTNKTVNENMEYVADFVTKEALNLELNIETGADNMGKIYLWSDIIDDTFFIFDLKKAVIGAAHAIATNYSKPYREKYREETKRDMAALRKSLYDAISVLDEAVEHPEKFDENFDPQQSR